MDNSEARSSTQQESPHPSLLPKEEEIDENQRRPPLQYSLRGLMLLTAAVALLFGTMRWLGVSPEASALVLVVLMIAATAAIGLLIVILRE